MEPFVLPDQGDVETVAGHDGVQPKAAQDFYMQFITDALLFALFRWLTNGAQQTPEEFIALLKSTTDIITTRLYK